MNDRDELIVMEQLLIVQEQSIIEQTQKLYDEITRRKQTEADLRESEEKFKAIFDNAVDGIVSADAKSRRMVFMNTAFCHMTGYTREELQALTVADMHPKQDLARSIEEFEKQLHREISGVRESPVKRKDGSVFYADISSCSINIGGMDYLMGFFRDVTERKEAQEKLKATQAQLLQSENLASIGQLAAGIAHEINNPIGYVLGNSESLVDYFVAIKEMIKFYDAQPPRDQITTKKKELDIDYIVNDLNSLLQDNIKGLNRVVEIVANLKNFSRVGQQQDIVEADLEENLKSTLLIARNEIKYHAEVKTEFEKVSSIFCNIGEINQVFLNILVNAAQAIQEQKRSSKGMITISTREDAEFIYCSIADDGPGIPKENRKKIFEPFFTTKPVGKGTGLGLNIAWDIIVNRHKGAITVEGEIGKGTCFTIKLPKRRETTA